MLTDCLRWNVRVHTTEGRPAASWEFVERVGPWILSTVEDANDEGWDVLSLNLYERDLTGAPRATFDHITVFPPT